MREFLVHIPIVLRREERRVGGVSYGSATIWYTELMLTERTAVRNTTNEEVKLSISPLDNTTSPCGDVW